jgi:Arc/MetJ-type ribon-helix-helix transcriptional regulator
MTNTIVSIRIPKSLVKELRMVSEKDHFMDLSEAVRSIVRAKWLSAKDPMSLKVEQLRQDILTNLSKGNQQALVEQLERIKEEIINSKKGG